MITTMQAGRGPHQHWVRRIERGASLFFSAVFSLVSAHAIWWFFSALNAIDPLEPLVTVFMGVGFAGLGFIVSRGLAHRIQHRQKFGAAFWIALAFEFVEVGCCFVQASVGIHHIGWLGLFSGQLHQTILLLCYLLLPVTPVFTLGLAWFDVNLDRERYGAAPAPAPVPQGIPASAPPVAPRPSFAPSAAPAAATGFGGARPHPAPGGLGPMTTMAPPPTYAQAAAAYPSVGGPYPSVTGAAASPFGPGQAAPSPMQPLPPMAASR